MDAEERQLTLINGEIDGKQRNDRGVYGSKD